MAIPGLHFSGVYKQALLSGEKKATVMDGEFNFNVGQEFQVYLSEKDNLFDGKWEKRIGKATIQKFEVKKVRELTDKEVRLCSHEDLPDLKQALEKWYNADKDSVVTFVKFDLELNHQNNFY